MLANIAGEIVEYGFWEKKLNSVRKLSMFLLLMNEQVRWDVAYTHFNHNGQFDFGERIRRRLKVFDQYALRAWQLILIQKHRQLTE